MASRYLEPRLERASRAEMTRLQTRRLREQIAHAAAAKTVRLDVASVTVTGGPPLAGVLVGLHDAGGVTLGIGRLRAADPDEPALTLDTPVDPRGVATISVGRETYRA